MINVEDRGLADPSTLVLLGAGASVDAGFPTSARLHELLLERLDPIYRNLARLVFRDGGTVDPERLFRVLEFLNALETPGEPFVTSLGNESHDISALVEQWHPDIAEYLEIGRYRLQGAPLQRTVDRLWHELVDIFSLKEPPTEPKFDYLRHLASKMRGQTIVTLNYDDALEHMSYARTYRIDSGPFPQPRATDDPLTAPLRLVKLHGSIDWSRENGTGDVVPLSPLRSFHHSFEVGEGHAPGIIFGAGNKLRPDGPYLALYEEFVGALAKARHVVVIGYSFRDAHVNEALRRWFLYQVDDGGLLRVGDVGEYPPAIVDRWRGQRLLAVEYVRGPASEMMVHLIAPRPNLMQS